MHKQAKHTTISLALTGALALFSVDQAAASTVTLSNTFVSGQPATAASVNQNFTDVKTAVDDNDSRITTNAGGLATLTTTVDSNTTNIGTNAGDIDTNTTSITANSNDITTNTNDIATNTDDIAANSTAIAGLEGGGGGTAPTGEDNPPIAVDCTTDSLQEAIEDAPLHGATVITISGNCADDIFVRRGDITIEGATGPGPHSITGNNSGFSSDASASYNLAASTGLVQKSLSGAVEISDQARVTLRNLSVAAGTNDVAVRAEKNTSLTLHGVTLTAGTGKYGLHASNSNIVLESSTLTGGTTESDPVSGSAILAEMNSVVELRAGNTFTGANGNSQAFVALSGSTVRWTGGNNAIIAGTTIGPEDETEALVVVLNSSLLQLTPATPASPTKGNTISGAISVSESSTIHLRNVAITNSAFIEAFAGSSFSLQPFNVGDITVLLPANAEFEAGSGSTLDLADQDKALDITNPDGGAKMRLLDHSTLLLWSGSSIDMDVDLFRSSSIDAGDFAQIIGDLTVSGFSSVAFDNQGTTDPVTGTVNCPNGEVFSDFVNICPTF